jgi:hypothetical protein
MTAGFLVTFSVRGLAIKLGWSLPVFRESATREQWKIERKPLAGMSDDSSSRSGSLRRGREQREPADGAGSLQQGQVKNR